MARGRDSRAVWEKRIERWEDSGLTAKEFALEIGVNHHTLSHWRYQLAREGNGSGATRRRSPAFVEVASTMLVGSEGIELVVKSGDVVRVPVGFDDTTLGRVLDLLEQRR